MYWRLLAPIPQLQLSGCSSECARSLAVLPLRSPLHLLSPPPTHGGGHLKTCVKGKGAMARARYYVEVIGADNSYFAYTYHHFAPAFFFARDPEDREKQDFLQLLFDTYHPKVMSERPWGCFSCGQHATHFVDRPSDSLHDAAGLAVHNMLLAVCPARACDIHAASMIDVSRKMSAETLGQESAGPEMLMCRYCHQLKETPFQKCGRCKGPSYCSVQCQKADWRRHKPNCNGHVEAMKLSSEELALLDQYTDEFTQGTGELKCWSHAGTLVPEVQQAMNLGRQLIDFAAKKAKERRRAMHEGQDEVKDKLLTVTEDRVDAATAASQEGQQVPDCFRIYQYFE